MVQLLVNPTLSSPGSSASAHEQTDGFTGASAVKQEATTTSREEHAQRMKELNLKRSMMRTPRRGWSLSDYHDNQHQSMPHYHPHYISQVERQAPIPENAVLQSSIIRPDSPASSTFSSASSTVGPLVQIPRRPKMPPPRRSQSVTDKEPEPSNQPRLPANMNLLDLPSELHYALFDFLDPIDGACLGLAHSRLYSIHRRKNGKVSLSSRYSGPNDREWAWRGAGPLIRRETSDLTVTDKALGNLRVKGQVYCRKCGVSRCELHRHLKDWMGSGYEYCEIRKMYGRPADEGAKSYCYMSSPKNPHRCGRHGGKKN
ncbi:F-box domain-containing protein [Pochonia chlamydosporia 170]|uniref:F-box domain-containing protein n=1 Tax=Pochonia chlamydosporia 170 TaxID=1380566 RepID=A0A179F921_METCM|nr:F-box domain-containing protein [Pochonia chlamydosporia 170]OAQ61942.1 F-box domain-containing protein [Pochonia chlamydosporia 170]